MRFPTAIAAALALALFVTLPGRLGHAAAASEPVLVIAGPKFPANDISLANLKSLYRGQPVLVAGKRVIPFNHPLGSPLRVSFDRMVLGLEPAAVGRFWVDMRIRDQGRPPTTATTPVLAVRVVAALETAITYTTASALIAGIKVLTVDGKAAGSSGYPFN